jgi:hypothetical protein
MTDSELSEAKRYGRLELACFNLSQRDPKLTGADTAIVAQLRGQFKLIGGEDLLSR